MSSLSSSKSDNSGAKDNNFNNDDQNDINQNPFIIPPDEKIFTFKEEEKEQKMS